MHTGDEAGVRGRIEAAPLYSLERDALLADLVRLFQRTRDGAPLALLYEALWPTIVRTMQRLGRDDEPHGESCAVVLLATAEAIDAFDPDRRSVHVQAGLERDIHHRGWRARRDEHRRRQAHAQCAFVWGSAAPGELAAWSIDDLLGVAGRNTTERFDEEERKAAWHTLKGFVRDGLLKPREAALLFGARVEGRRLVEVAEELGMGVEAAKKATQRAARSLQRRLRALQRGPERDEEDGEGRT